MSTETRSFILKEMRDVEVVFESIARLKFSYQEQGNRILVSNGVILNISDAGILAQFEEPHQGRVPEKHKFIKQLQDTYSIALQEKIERLRRELAASQEKEALTKIQQDKQQESIRRGKEIAQKSAEAKSIADRRRELGVLQKVTAEEKITPGVSKREQDLKRKRELDRLESILRAEKLSLQKKIEEEAQIIADRGESYGYNVEISRVGERRVILLTRVV